MEIAQLTEDYKKQHLAVENYDRESASSEAENSTLVDGITSLQAIFSRCKALNIEATIHGAAYVEPPIVSEVQFTDEVTDYDTLADIPVKVLNQLTREAITSTTTDFVNDLHGNGCKCIGIHILCFPIEHIKESGDPLTIRITYKVCSMDKNKGEAPGWA